MVALCCAAPALLGGGAAHAAADTAAPSVGDTTPADPTSPIGVWRTVDDRTHEPKALIEIARDPSGALTGRILTGLGRNHHPGSRCTACTDERKDQPMQGLTIIRHLQRNGDVWEGGEILDPENGKTYHCRMQLADQGARLIVRGYLGVPLLGRSQTWIRDTASAGDAAR
ncbi:MAG: DUF2147 domain-containing protein [Janthinobacterium lividum]